MSEGFSSSKFSMDVDDGLRCCPEILRTMVCTRRNDLRIVNVLGDRLIGILDINVNLYFWSTPLTYAPWRIIASKKKLSNPDRAVSSAQSNPASVESLEYFLDLAGRSRNDSKSIYGV